ncbi:MAG: hydroxyacid dehydrogenase [Abditibacteriales bacterium]|nr:hydroxyacid dehydrogenase [Abditibacteriales bacterium]MDW8366242.1 hydroxyacid dehydrogenase [Abditibacteriales bacterium]
MAEKFRIGITRDLLNEKGEPLAPDIGLSLLDAAPHVEYEFFKEHRNPVTPDQLRDFDGVMSLAPRYTRESFAGVERLTVIARFGVGYDNIDLQAATEANVAVFIVPDGVRRPVAESVLTLMLALSKKLLLKDKLTRTGRWRQHPGHLGTLLGGRTLGLIGLGNIGSEVVRLVQPFAMRVLAYDPYVSVERAASLDVTLTDLDTLLRESDFVSVHCPLTPETHHLIGAREFRLMKPTAYFINTARGAIVDQKALTAALQSGQIAGAGIDVFEVEPVPPDEPLLQLENVIVTPHGICWTEECLRDNGRLDCLGLLKVARGEVPDHVVNKEVLNQPGFQEKLRRYRADKCV